MITNPELILAHSTRSNFIEVILVPPMFPDTPMFYVGGAHSQRRLRFKKEPPT